jgi:cation:H+ antiporter
MELPFEILKFLLSLGVLIVSAELLVRNSEKLGLSLGVPQFIVGITIISAGTSLPELATSIFSIAKGEAGVVAGNVVGSNIANILLVVGLTTVIVKRVEIKRSIIRLDLPLLLGASAILLLSLVDGKFSFMEAVISLIGFAVYLIYSVTQHKDTFQEKEEKLLKTLKQEKRPPFKWRYLGIVVIAAITLYLSADFTINSVIAMGGILNIDTAVIAITAIAIGTSLPELIVSALAARRGNFDIALGNILGSNIFNGLMIMGVSGMITELPVQPAVLIVGVPFLIIATILLAFSGIERKFYNFEGAFYLLLYILFVGQLFSNTQVL